MVKKASVAVVVSCLLLGCGAPKKAPTPEHEPRAEKNARVSESETAADLHGKWSDNHSRLVARELMADGLSKAWIPAYVGITGGKPVVTVGAIHNWTGEPIDAKALGSCIEGELSNSGQVSFVVCKEDCKKISEEGVGQQEYISPEGVTRIKAETGADFVLVGAIKTMTDETEGAKAACYQAELELMNTKTMAVVWAGTKKIKK